MFYLFRLDLPLFVVRVSFSLYFFISLRQLQAFPGELVEKEHSLLVEDTNV